MRFIIGIFLPIIGFGMNIDTLMSKQNRFQGVVFQSKASIPLNIQMARVYFLGSSTCYEQYMAKQEFETGMNPLILAQDEQISLSPKGLYQAALASVGRDEILHVRSALLRLRTVDRTWLKFLGTCEDQKDNCCFPIHCHPSVEECVPQISDELQFVSD